MVATRVVETRAAAMAAAGGWVWGRGWGRLSGGEGGVVVSTCMLGGSLILVGVRGEKQMGALHPRHS